MPKEPMQGSTDHLWNIEGQKTEDGPWFPLYCYSNSGLAKGIFGAIVDMDEADLPPDIADFEDFRLVPPTRELEQKQEATTARYFSSPPESSAPPKKREPRKQRKGSSEDAKSNPGGSVHKRLPAGSGDGTKKRSAKKRRASK